MNDTTKENSMSLTTISTIILLLSANLNIMPALLPLDTQIEHFIASETFHSTEDTKQGDKYLSILDEAGYLPHLGYTQFTSNSSNKNSIAIHRGFNHESNHLFYWSPRLDGEKITLYNSTNNLILFESTTEGYITTNKNQYDEVNRYNDGQLNNFFIDLNHHNYEISAQFNIVKSYHDIPYDIDWFFIENSKKTPRKYSDLQISDLIIQDLQVPIPLEIILTPDPIKTNELAKSSTNYFSSTNHYTWYDDNSRVDHTIITAHATIVSDLKPHEWEMKIIEYTGPRSTPDKKLIAQKTIQTQGNNLLESLNLSISQKELLVDQSALPVTDTEYELQIFLDSKLFSQSFFQITKDGQDIYKE